MARRLRQTGVPNSTLKLARATPEPELAMDLLMADAVLQFGSDLREARDAASAWCRCDRQRHH